MATPKSILESSDVLGAFANPTMNASDCNEDREIKAIETSSTSASLEDLNSGEVAGCGGGGCLAVA